MSAMAYHEPDRITILVQSSFLLLLNVVENVLNRALYCGLLGQLLLGMAYGLPGGNLLTIEAQIIVVQLGYLGLILLVYEGGLSVPLSSLRTNIHLSVAVALTGVATPIALSFVLQPMMGATPLQAFAAGAALCSTSLGTTFTVLTTSRLMDTRLGAVLSTAAMMDDVMGLVMVQVIREMGSSAPVKPVVVLRPVLVSMAFAVLVPAMLHYVVRPLGAAVGASCSLPKALADSASVRFMLHMLLLFGMVGAAAWSGTSVLFTAYLTGTLVNWGDGSPTTKRSHSIPVQPATNEAETSVIQAADILPPEDLSGQALYHKYLGQPVSRILRPLFFASIGFSIPITTLFRGPLLWRGIIYAILMAFGKVVCGLWILPSRSTPRTKRQNVIKRLQRRKAVLTSFLRKPLHVHDQQRTAVTADGASAPVSTQPTENGISTASTPPTQQQQTDDSPYINADVSSPLSLYPASILGFAMVSRGEIGFLISSVAESAGIWRHETATSKTAPSNLFVVVTWAIVLCTFAGPVAVGLTVNRVRRLEKQREPAGRIVLGSWGISAQLSQSRQILEPYLDQNNALFTES